MSLADLLTQTTPGPWEASMAAVLVNGYVIATTQRDTDAGTYETMDADARLVALAPDLAKLAIDMAAFLRGDYHPPTRAAADALLARFAALDQRATVGE